MKIQIKHHQLTKIPTNIMVFCYKYSDRLECVTHGVTFNPKEYSHFNFSRAGTWNVKYKNR